MVDSLRGPLPGSTGLLELAHELGAPTADPLSMRALLEFSTRPATYRVFVKTGDAGFAGGAGTDADVFLTMTGRRGASAELELDKKGRNVFESGELDEFELVSPNLGYLTEIRIRHDNSDPLAAAWKLDWIQVERPGTDLFWRFDAFRWLSRDPGDAPHDCAIDITILVGQPPIPTPGVPLRCYKKPSPSALQTAPAIDLPRASSLQFYNCMVAKRDVNLWRLDWTAGTAPEFVATVSSGYDDMGACGPGVVDSLYETIDLPIDGHVYEFRVLDTGGAGCDGVNDVENGGCLLSRHALIADSTYGPGVLSQVTSL